MGPVGCHQRDLVGLTRAGGLDPHRLRSRRPGRAHCRRHRSPALIPPWQPHCRWPRPVRPRLPIPERRFYAHDAWHSATCTILLPDKGAVMGALAPVFTPTIGR